MNLSPLHLKSLAISPPLFLAPMAGITHSAFRYLIAGFGGYGALYTEMLPGVRLLNEKVGFSPFTKRRPEEGIVFYQLALNGSEDIPAIIDRLNAVSCQAIDLNAGCPAPDIHKAGAGVGLFRDAKRFERVLTQLRTCWNGVLTVKCRLWQDEPEWKSRFLERLAIIEGCGADAFCVHPRFFDQKLKRTALWEHFGWIAAATRLPLIANGDICGAGDILANPECFASVKGLMIGRMAAVKPWIFREITAGLRESGITTTDAAAPVDYAQVWSRIYDYVIEDFAPSKAIGRLREFTHYFACNFFYGHQFERDVRNAASLEAMRVRALRFLSTNPKVLAEPSVVGI
jgi:tRNA-dihydrouridine synthase B